MRVPRQLRRWRPRRGRVIDRRPQSSSSTWRMVACLSMRSHPVRGPYVCACLLVCAGCSDEDPVVVSERRARRRARPCIPREPVYTTSLVNTLVRGYRYTCEPHFLDAAKPFFARGNAGIYGEPTMTAAPEGSVHHWSKAEALVGLCGGRLLRPHAR